MSMIFRVHSRAGNHEDILLTLPHPLLRDEPSAVHTRDAGPLADGVMPETVVLRQPLARGIDDVARCRGWGGVLG